MKPEPSTCEIEGCTKLANYIIGPLLIADKQPTTHVCKDHLHEGILQSRRQSNIVIWRHPQPVQEESEDVR